MALWSVCPRCHLVTARLGQHLDWHDAVTDTVNENRAEIAHMKTRLDETSPVPIDPTSGDSVPAEPDVPPTIEL